MKCILRVSPTYIDTNEVLQINSTHPLTKLRAFFYLVNFSVCCSLHKSIDRMIEHHKVLNFSCMLTRSPEHVFLACACLGETKKEKNRKEKKQNKTKQTNKTWIIEKKKTNKMWIIAKNKQNKSKRKQTNKQAKCG